MDIQPLIQNCYDILKGRELSFRDALKLIQTPPPFTMDLYSLANKVREKFSRGFHVCSILNAKSGKCGEDCFFCAQSSFNKGAIRSYPLMSAQKLVEEAAKVKSYPAAAFSIVTSGYGYQKRTREFQSLLNSIEKIKNQVKINVHVSIGVLSEENIRLLKEAGVDRIHHNIETAPSFFSKICKTHDIQDRFKTIRNIKKQKVPVCCGGILGLGENRKQRIEFFYTLKDLDVDSIPINIFQKLEGTRIRTSGITVTEILNAVAVCRLINPGKTIIMAAGRETILKDYQGLIFHAGANGMMTGGYLTLKGRPVEEDRNLLDSFPRCPPL
ncbi:MAG: biotin synthase BioB [Candidatus Aureabacteria bacterium]|nr:biotin synthase BioB [Candidatus Auribacterota bacterium]